MKKTGAATGRRRHARRGISATIAVLAAGATVTAAPAAAEVQDATCAASVNSGASGPGNLRYAQTFTAQNSGALTRATIAITRAGGSNGDYVVQIVAVSGSGVPTNTVLASTTVADATVPDGQSTLGAPFGTPAEVVAGQQYALLITRPGSTDLTVRVHTPDACPGQMFASPDQSGAFSLFLGGGYDYIFAVFVEPPAAPPQDPTAPPDTTITGGPEGKTKSKSATLAFSGSDARAVASFECRLDSGAFEPCTSPKTYSGLKKGSHTFSVRAVDDAGIADPTPATRTWTVKKKKKKKKK